MAKSGIRAHWDKVITDLELRLTKARAVREALDDPELAEEVAKSLGVQPCAEKTRKKKRRSTHAEKVVGFFQEHNNEWADSFEISDGIRIKREAVRQVLYKTGADRVERRSSPNGSRKVQFRLKSP
jgi:hypothetical protein